jgi:hypothetical protein
LPCRQRVSSRRSNAADIRRAGSLTGGGGARCGGGGVCRRLVGVGSGRLGFRIWVRFWRCGARSRPCVGVRIESRRVGVSRVLVCCRGAGRFVGGVYVSFAHLDARSQVLDVAHLGHLVGHFGVRLRPEQPGGKTG